MINTMFQTSMGDFVFDAVFSTEHHANLVVTEHPVQSGASIADHAYMEPDEISLEIGMSDTGGEGRSVRMYQMLKQLMMRREPMRVVTRFENYENMLIMSMSAPDNYETMHAFKASLVIKQVKIVSVATVQVQQTVSASKTPETEGSGSGSASGQSQQQSAPAAKETKASVLSQLFKDKAEKKIKTAEQAKKAATVKTSKATVPIVKGTATEAKVKRAVSLAAKDGLRAAV